MNTLRRWQAIRTHILLIVFSLLMLYPVLWWIGASLKKESELSSPTLWPSIPQWVNYTSGWHFSDQFNFTHFYTNSFIMEFFNVLGSVVTCGLVAYAFARLNFKLRNLWFAVMMLTLMLPSQVTVVPQYIMWNNLGMVNSFFPLIIPHFFGGGAFFIFLAMQFIRGIPRELDEAANIDGCSVYGIYFKIILPLITPALFTVGIFTFIWSWDDFFGQVLYLNGIENYTVGLALRMFIGQYTVQWGQLLAMSLVSVIPSAIIFFSAQKYFVEGIATTGIKG